MMSVARKVFGKRLQGTRIFHQSQKSPLGANAPVSRSANEGDIYKFFGTLTSTEETGSMNTPSLHVGEGPPRDGGSTPASGRENSPHWLETSREQGTFQFRAVKRACHLPHPWSVFPPLHHPDSLNAPLRKTKLPETQCPLCSTNTRLAGSCWTVGGCTKSPCGLLGGARLAWPPRSLHGEPRARRRVSQWERASFIHLCTRRP